MEVVDTDAAWQHPDDQDLPSDDDRFVETIFPSKPSPSNAQNDSGVFELGFRDERYLPFEGAGCYCERSLELCAQETPP